MSHLQPESANQLKFNFFPDIWSEYDPGFNSDYGWKPFPNGRRRRAIQTDPLTGQQYESYEAVVEQIGNVPLAGAVQKGVNDTADDAWDDEFDDQFEEDISEKKMQEEFFHQQHQPVVNGADEIDGPDLSSSRWVAYEALGSTLTR